MTSSTDEHTHAPRDVPFERVELLEEKRTLSAREFFRLPLADRVRLILQRQLRFWSGEELVDSTYALRWLREQRSQTESK